MTLEQQKKIFKEAIKNEIPVMHTDLGKALDFADKFVELGNEFSKLSPDAKEKIIKSFFVIAANSPLQFN